MGGSPSSSTGLQRQHLEIGLILISGGRLCCAVAGLGTQGAAWHAWSLFLVHLLALVLEFGHQQLASPYKLRKSESHGIAQGVLAVPSVLAALTTIAPQGAWTLWLQGSCAAAVSILLTLYLQSEFAAAAATASTAQHQSDVQRFQREHNTDSRTVNGCPNVHGAVHNTQQPDSQHQQGLNDKQLRKQQQRTVCNLLTVLPAALYCLLAVAAGWQVSVQGGRNMLPLLQLLPQHQQWLQVLSHVSIPAVALSATLAPALYCLIMQLLPSCFSIGEGALMAEGAAALAVAAAMALPDAPVFVPTAVCQMLPQPALELMSSLGGCSSSSHTRAVSLEALPSAILLVVASALLVCLLLRGMLVMLGSSGSSSSKGSAGAAAVPAGAKKPAKGGANISRTSKNSSSAQQLHHWLAAAVLAASMGVVLLWLSCAAAWTLLEFLPARQGGLLVLLYWVGLLAATLPALRLWASHSRVPQIVVRKVYHLLAGGLFVPVFFWDLQMLGLSLAIAFNALVLLEVLRRLQLPMLGKAVQQFMQDFVDERDSGVIYVTHFTLLLGLAVPMWLCLGLTGIQSFAGVQQMAGDSSSVQCHGSSCSSIDSSSSGGGGGADLLLVMAGMSGMMIIGVGDTAASMVGKLLGRVPIHAGSRKTVEGTVAGIASTLGAWCLLLWFGGLAGGGWQWWCQLLLATCGAGLMEACTSQLDNILLPLWYLPHLVLVKQ